MLVILWEITVFLFYLHRYNLEINFKAHLFTYLFIKNLQLFFNKLYFQIFIKWNKNNVYKNNKWKIIYIKLLNNNINVSVGNGKKKEILNLTRNFNKKNFINPKELEI